MIYGDVGEFTHDQEQIIVNEMFDFVEGFVVCNNNDPVNGWGQVAFTLDDSDQLDDFANRIPPDCGPILYCLELAKYYNDDDDEYIDNTILMDEVQCPSLSAYFLMETIFLHFQVLGRK